MLQRGVDIKRFFSRIAKFHTLLIPTVITRAKIFGKLLSALANLTFMCQFMRICPQTVIIKMSNHNTGTHSAAM